MTDPIPGAEAPQMQFRKEGQPAFPIETPGNDNPADSSTDKTPIDPTQPPAGGEPKPGEQPKVENGEEGKDNNFANHPRWKEREDDWTKRFNDQETRHLGEIEKIRTDMEEKFKQTTQTKPEVKANEQGEVDPGEMPSWFGGDEAQWKEFSAWNNGLLAKAEERGAEKAMKGIEEKSASEKKAIDDATTYFKGEVDKIELDKTINPTGEKVDQNKLLKFVLDNDLVDSKGQWNYRAAFIMMKGAAPKAPDNKSREKLANASIDDRTAPAKPSNVTTSDDFNKPGARPW